MATPRVDGPRVLRAVGTEGVPAATLRQDELPAELRIVLSTASENSDLLKVALAGGRERRDPKTGFKWDHLFLVSEREGATPVLARQLSDLERQGLSVPGGPDTLSRLQRLAMIRRFRLLELDRRLDAFLDVLAAEGRSVVLLKGAALARSAYGSVVERPMADVDLLVEKGTADAVWKLAAQAGWEPGRPDIPRSAYDDHHHLPPMTDSTGLGLGLEIHTEIFPERNPFRFSAADIWRRARSLGRRGDHNRTGVLIPCPEHLLLHTALHFTWSHTFGFGVWKTFRDIHAVTSAETVDWDELARNARTSRGETGLFWTLHLARTWGGVALAEAFIDEMGGRVPRLLRTPLRRHFAIRLAPGRSAPPPIVVSQRLWEMAMQPERSGHGSIRPWDESEKWLGEASTEADSGSTRGPSVLGRYVKGALAGGRYLLRLLSRW